MRIRLRRKASGQKRTSGDACGWEVSPIFGFMDANVGDALGTTGV
jgi:hypothetical protein